MARPSTMRRFTIDLSDADRNQYQVLEFRAAQHPSETTAFLAARVLAYCLNAQEGLEMTQGIGDPDEPAMRRVGSDGRVALWIDIGQPDPRRLHKASKLGARVRVYTHKDPWHYLKTFEGEHVHRAEDIDLFSFDAGFLESIGTILERDNRWVLTVSGATLYLSAGGRDLTGELRKHPLGKA